MRVFIGVDPHKLSATIEVVDDREAVLATGRFGTDKAGYADRKKRPVLANVAVARELAGWCWSLAMIPD